MSEWTSLHCHLLTGLESCFLTGEAGKADANSPNPAVLHVPCPYAAGLLMGAGSRWI